MVSLLKKNLKFAAFGEPEIDESIQLTEKEVQQYWLDEFDKQIRKAGLAQKDQLSKVSTPRSEEDHEWDGTHD